MGRLALFFIVLAIVAGVFGMGNLADEPSLSNALLVYVLLGAAAIAWIADLMDGR